MQNDGVQMLMQNKFKTFIAQTPSSAEKLLDTIPVCTLKHVVPIETMRQILADELIRLVSQMNVSHNMEWPQIEFTIETLLEQFQGCSLEDFLLTFKRLGIGYYGSTYHQLDASVIIATLARVLDEKALYQENQNTQRKEEEASVDYAAFKKRLDEKRKEGQTDFKQERARQLKDMEADLLRAAYKPPTEQEVRKKELHLQYVRENYNLISGHKTKDWIEEESWIEKQRVTENAH